MGKPESTGGKIAITLESCHAVEVLLEAFTHHGRPEIINTDQGSQFTADEFVRTVKEQGCRLSLDGRGAWRDNIFVERLWKSVKYERVAYYCITICSTFRYHSCYSNKNALESAIIHKISASDRVRRTAALPMSFALLA
ncbi:MAG: transposase family protein [Desulfobulbaceae bacterium]|nr:MAG: transposase family protein [Desulfobulbaceae bacterium]